MLSPPPPLFEQNCKEMVQIAGALGISCDDPVSTFINGQADGLLLRDVCRATCGACIPYLGAHASIVQVEVRTATDVAGVIGSASFPALLAEGINATGSQIQSFSNNVSLIAREVGLADDLPVGWAAGVGVGTGGFHVTSTCELSDDMCHGKGPLFENSTSDDLSSQDMSRN